MRRSANICLNFFLEMSSQIPISVDDNSTASIFNWSHLVVIFMMSLLFFIIGIGIGIGKDGFIGKGGFIAGTVTWTKIVGVGSGVGYTFRFLLHHKLGLIQHAATRYVINCIFAAAFVFGYLYIVFSYERFSIGALLMIIPIGSAVITCYYNMILGKSSPIHGWD